MTYAESLLEDMCLRGFLRYLSKGPRSPYYGLPTALTSDDIDALRMWWALSDSVGALAIRCANYSREIRASFDDFRQETSGQIPGPPDATASALLQAITCDPCAFVVTESMETWVSGPNRVLAKTLDSARNALRSAALHARGGLFDGPARDRMAIIDDALRSAPLREILSSPAGRSPITAHERRQAAKARAPLYRLSWDCASTAIAIEKLKPSAIAALLKTEVLPKLETWRQFELACLLELSAALAAASGSACALDASFTPTRPAARIGDLEIWWQRAVYRRPNIHLDEGERLAANLAASLGVTAGTARADLTIERGGQILGIVECKWFNDESSRSGAILDACNQVVGYARDAAWNQGGNTDEILSRSLVALAIRGSTPLRVGAGPIGCIDLEDLRGASMQQWADSILLA